MAAISISVSRALVLNSHKASEFLNKKVNTSADAIKRFENRKEGKGASEKEKWDIYMAKK